MHGDVVLETWREYMHAVIGGLADDLGPELAGCARRAYGIALPSDDEDEAHERG